MKLLELVRSSEVVASRSLHGERGLKFFIAPYVAPELLSLPSRGAWIEIRSEFAAYSRPLGRSLHGERGLKYKFRKYWKIRQMSLPSRGAWIEIAYLYNTIFRILWSLPSRGAWIEISLYAAKFPAIIGRSLHGERGLKYLWNNFCELFPTSLPSRGAWIEID